MGTTDNVIPFPKGGVAGLETAVLIELIENKVVINSRCVSIADGRTALRHLLIEVGELDKGGFMIPMVGEEAILMRYADMDVTFTPVTAHRRGN